MDSEDFKNSVLHKMHTALTAVLGKKALIFSETFN